MTINVSRRFLLTSVAAFAAVPAAAANGMIYRDAKAPVALRVKDLLKRMTLDEKVAQLCCLWFGKNKIIDAKTGVFSVEKASVAMPHGIGQIGRPSDTAGMQIYGATPFRQPGDVVEFMNAVQHYAVEKTRLGIPVLFHEETAHGLAVKGATSFPIPPALGSTWDTELVERVFTHVAKQARGRGVTVGLSPVLDLVRDPRWGRSEEFFGEDPCHVAEMGTAAVRGLQGRSRPIAGDRIFATLKHFVHGTPMNGINTAPSDMSERALREYFLPPFAKAIGDGHAAIVMPSYNEIGGVPSHGNKGLLQDTGRKLLGFQGPYFSDYGAVQELNLKHHMAANRDEAAVLALQAGVDADLPDGACYSGLAALVTTGRVPIASVDAAASRILALKFEAGLFEQPYIDADRAAAVLADPVGPQLALLAAQKSIVLLKNDGILPLDPAKAAKIGLIGPSSVIPRLGGYSGKPDAPVGVLDGLKAAAGASITIEQADGVWITKADGSPRLQYSGMIGQVAPAENDERIRAAAALAARSDIVVLVVGDNEQITRETVSITAPGDRNSIDLFGDQNRLVDAVLATGKPVVAILLNGRPLSVTTLAAKANALVEGWYLGEQAGNALADVLFGRVNPGGKLAVSFPRSTGEIPAYYDRHPSADGGPYVEGKRQVLFPFGHGLSYTDFTVSAPRLSTSIIGPTDNFTVEVDVANTGRRSGDEVVQIYIRDLISTVPRPVLELKAFRRVWLKAGERQTVRFDMGPQALAFWDADMKWSVEPGQFKISAGNSSAHLQDVTLTVS